MPTVYGVVSSSSGAIFDGAQVLIKNEKFEDLYTASTDGQGEYSIEVNAGEYYAMAIVKDYMTRFLEYWAWDVPIFEDVEINARLGGLEVYGVNTFRVQGAWPSIFVYFRPMSLQRHRESGQHTEKDAASTIIDISPNLVEDDIQIVIENQPVRVLQVNKVVERAGGDALYAYLVQAAIPSVRRPCDRLRVDIEVTDRQTGERGEATVFTPLL